MVNCDINRKKIYLENILRNVIIFEIDEKLTFCYIANHLWCSLDGQFSKTQPKNHNF